MKSTRRHLFSLAIGGLFLCVPASGFAQPVRITVIKPKSAPAKPDAVAPKADRPAWQDVEQGVKSALAQTKGYQAGDLITREEAVALFAELKKLGWDVKDQDKLGERMLPSNDDLVKQLRGTEGVRFMREIGKVPEGFDRLDHLRALPGGQKRVKELIGQPGGYTLIQYMAATPGGQNMGRELSSKKRGDFNAQTKRIYTEAQLLSELKTRYETESVSLLSPQ